MFALHLSVTLYNCSYGRNDCSLCLAARPEYKCVWCEEDGKPSKCVYEKLCHTPPTDTCPPPEITHVRLLFLSPYQHSIMQEKAAKQAHIERQVFFLGC